MGVLSRSEINNLIKEGTEATKRALFPKSELIMLEIDEIQDAQLAGKYIRGKIADSIRLTILWKKYEEELIKEAATVEP